MIRALWVVLIGFGLAWPAQAAPRRPALHWTRGRDAASCIDPLTLTARVEALLGPVFAPPADYAVEGHIDAQPGGFRLRLSITRADGAPHGERIVDHHGSDCRAFDEAIVFLIALTIDPDLELERLTRDPTLDGHMPEEVLLRELDATPPVPVQLAPPPPAPARDPAPPPSPTPYRAEASAAMWFAARELPSASVGPSLAVQLPVARWFELGAQLRVMSTLTPHALSAGHALRAQTFAFAPLLCVRPPTAWWSVRACVGPEPSLVRARGIGFTPNERTFLSVWGVVAKLELGVRLSAAWSLLAQGFVRATLEQKRLVYTDESSASVEIERFARGAAGGGVGIGYRFGSGKRGAADTHVQDEEIER